MTRALLLAELNIYCLVPCLLIFSHVLLLHIQIYKLALNLIPNHPHFKQRLWEMKFTRKNKYPVAIKSLIGTQVYSL